MNINTSKESYSDTVEKGLVMSQNPKAGNKVAKGSTVTVIISKGKEEIPPKEVVRELTIPYEPEEPGEQQEIKIYIEDMNRSMTEPAEEFFITGTTKKNLYLQLLQGK